MRRIATAAQRWTEAEIMREILFRVKRLDNGEWVYGNFCMDALEQTRGLCGLDGFIRRYNTDTKRMEMYEADRETVGQYTGLVDKNGRRIFEGDIVKSIETKETGVVQFFPEHSAFMVWCKFSNEVGFLYECTSIAEVIGNIHDNPELLEDA
jgi:uncharacterized phage protein (TIGR01671 family)